MARLFDQDGLDFTVLAECHDEELAAGLESLLFNASKIKDDWKNSNKSYKWSTSLFTWVILESLTSYFGKKLVAEKKKDGIDFPDTQRKMLELLQTPSEQKEIPTRRQFASTIEIKMQVVNGKLVPRHKLAVKVSEFDSDEIVDGFDEHETLRWLRGKEKEISRKPTITAFRDKTGNLFHISTFLKVESIKGEKEAQLFRYTKGKPEPDKQRSSIWIYPSIKKPDPEDSDRLIQIYYEAFPFDSKKNEIIQSLQKLKQWKEWKEGKSHASHPMVNGAEDAVKVLLRLLLFFEPEVALLKLKDVGPQPLGPLNPISVKTTYLLRNNFVHNHICAFGSQETEESPDFFQGDRELALLKIVEVFMKIV